MVAVMLEHLTVSAASPTDLAVRVERVALPDGIDPVQAGFGREADALSHSTSWRYEWGTVVLTFMHVLADGSPLDATWSGAPEELESEPVACHAVRHLHFLRHTDPDIRSGVGLTDFWTYAARVADHHYPAVAGLLAEHDLERMDYSI